MVKFGRHLGLTAFALAASVTLATPARAQEGEQVLRPPPPAKEDKPPFFGALAALLVVGGAVVAANLIPSKRGHQD